MHWSVRLGLVELQSQSLRSQLLETKARTLHTLLLAKTKDNGLSFGVRNDKLSYIYLDPST
ncbi:MAG: hypothetical protein V7K35_28470 [Nostoc sp.]|uniref:hypothetical protein n=1 Tax=Nostoc sp. TaxID=1180 RepID=UPI002FF7495F